MQAVYETATGRLVSVGTVVADPLPAGLTAVDLTAQQYADLQSGAGTWDEATHTVVPTPGYVDPVIIEGNRTAVETNLASDLVAMQTIIDTANTTITVSNISQAQQALRDALQRDKDLARVFRRLIRLAINDLSGTD